MTEQRDNINRVRDAIARHVQKFVDAHIEREFHIEELQKYVATHSNGYVAPASPDRILRDLRQKNVVNYCVVNRRQSLYKGLPVPEVVQGELF